MYCIRCGKQLADGTKYCIYCGAPTAIPKKPEETSPEDDFTIAVPKDYVQRDAGGMDATQHISFGQDFVPDPAEEYIPEGLQDEISQVIDEELGEREQEYTRAVAREDIAQAMREQHAADDEDAELQQYVQDVMTSEDSRPPEQAEPAPEESALPQEDTRAFAADIQEMLAEREQKAEPASVTPPEEEAEDTDELLQKYVQEVMAESGRDVPPVADEIEDEGYTRAIARDEIHRAMHEYAEQATRVVSKEEIHQAEKAEEAEPKPDEIEQTRVVSKEAIHQAEKAEPEPDEIEQTRVVSKEEIRQAQKPEPEPEEPIEAPIDVDSIPDIPIPTDFVATEETSRPMRRNRIKREADLEEDTEDGPEQIISGRGIAVVVIIVILLFALAVGACVMALNGGGAADAGSGSGDVGFSYGQSDSSAKG